MDLDVSSRHAACGRGINDGGSVLERSFSSLNALPQHFLDSVLRRKHGLGFSDSELISQRIFPFARAECYGALRMNQTCSLPSGSS